MIHTRLLNLRVPTCRLFLNALCLWVLFFVGVCVCFVVSLCVCVCVCGWVYCGEFLV